MTAYHWTSKANASKILQDGLKPGSWICRYPEDWRGEVCLKLDVDIDWDNPEKFDWQRRVFDGLSPENIMKHDFVRDKPASGSPR